MIPAGTESYRYVLGYRLKMIRNKQGLSIRELIKIMSIDISPNAISKIENGLMYPNIKTLIALSQALNISIDYLVCNEIKEDILDIQLS